MVSTDKKITEIAAESTFFKPGGVTEIDLKNQQA